MFIDSRELPADETITADVCIIGSGAAGITLARELGRQRLDVCVLESGGFELDPETQMLYEGATVGRQYVPLIASRLRYFGGTTNHWNGACIPLDEIDFEARPDLNHEGWPFGLAELVPFYRRAHDVCGLGPFDYDPDTWTHAERPRVDLADDLRASVMQGVPPDRLRFGHVFREEIARATNIRTYLYANVVEVQSDPDGGRIDRLDVRTLDGKRLWVTAKVVILATGGIENPRLLLNSNAVHKEGLGNKHDLVGRYFMEHPGLMGGLVLPTNFDHRFFDYHQAPLGESGRFIIMYGIFLPTAQFLREQQLMNFGISLRPVLWDRVSPGVASVKEMLQEIKKPALPDDLMGHLGRVVEDIDDVALAAYRDLRCESNWLFQIGAWTAQSPNPASRVYLGDQLDRFGYRRPVLEWRLNELDTRNIAAAYTTLAEELGESGRGRLRLDMDLNEIEPYLGPGFHHSGTTRMHASPRQGVVDENCKVHGLANLYVAGSSVFTTSGQANPTLTIVALAIRLADHVATKLSHEVVLG